MVSRHHQNWKCLWWDNRAKEDMAVALLLGCFSPPSPRIGFFSYATPSPSSHSYSSYFPSSFSFGHFRDAHLPKIASHGGSLSSTLVESSRELREIYEGCSTWRWKEFGINYLVKGEGPPLLLVHGFGASVAHWRRNIGVLSEFYTVYAIDLLGFGASEKPTGFAYTMETWAQLILDFLAEVIRKPTVLIGNSVGSLACVMAASGGMNNKAIVDDWRIKLLLPLLWLVDFLLKQRGVASALFERVKQRENLKNILLSVYGNKESVDEELIEIIKRPADDDGALDAFISIVTGPPGPNPMSLMPKISLPVLVLWGDQDPFTPLDGPVGKYFSALPSRFPNLKLYVLEGVGHCPHDDRPDLVHEKLLPWLASLQAQSEISVGY